MQASPLRSLRVVLAILTVASSGLLSAQDSGPVLLPGVTAKAHRSSLADMEKAASAGDRDMAFVVADRYHHGNDAPKDVAKAIGFYEKAADAGHADAAFRLGKLYEDGTGVEQDPAKAADYYRHAAFAGVMEAQHNLGAMYIEGTKIKRNYVEGLAWLMVAKRNGDTSGDEEMVRKRFISSNRGRLVEEAHKLAEKYASGDRTGSPVPELSPVWRNANPKAAAATRPTAPGLPHAQAPKPDAVAAPAPKIAPQMEKIAPPKVELPAPKP